MGFPKESLNFFKIAKWSNFAVKCNWKSKTSENIQNLFFFKWIIWDFRKEFVNFLKTANDEKFVLGCNWISKISQKLKSWLLLENKGWFFVEKTWVLWKPLRAANLLQNATELVGFLKTFRTWAFDKKLRFSKRYVECF